MQGISVANKRTVSVNGQLNRRVSYSQPYWGECIIAKLMRVKILRGKEINLTFQLYVVDIYQNNETYSSL